MFQNYSDYQEQDFKVWRLLYERQLPSLMQHACYEYLDCLEQLSTVVNADEPPRFDSLNELLMAKNGWSIKVVPGFLPVDEFFELLANRKFCSSTWLRREDQLDYLEEPDMFHDIFGHIPLYMNKAYANYAQKLGELGVRFAGSPEIITQLQRLYWFTIEFGLIKEDNKSKAYGAGIASSSGEIKQIYSNPSVEILPFDIELVMQNDFIISEVQNRYYEIESFEQLFATVKELEERFSAVTA
jgi:phenylalanine-4-hydroxylase